MSNVFSDEEIFKEILGFDCDEDDEYDEDEPKFDYKHHECLCTYNDQMKSMKTTNLKTVAINIFIRE